MEFKTIRLIPAKNITSESIEGNSEPSHRRFLIFNPLTKQLTNQLTNPLTNHTRQSVIQLNMNSPLPKRARNFQEHIPPIQKESSIFIFNKPFFLVKQFAKSNRGQIQIRDVYSCSGNFIWLFYKTIVYNYSVAHSIARILLITKMYNESNLPYSCSGDFTSVNGKNVTLEHFCQVLPSCLELSAAFII